MGICHLTLLFINSCALFLALFLAYIVIFCLAALFFKPLTIFLVFNIDLKIFILFTTLAFFNFFGERRFSRYSLTLGYRNISASFLRNCETILHFLFLTLLFRNFVTDLLVLIFALFFWNLFTLFFWCTISRLVRWFTNFFVDCFASFFDVFLTFYIFFISAPSVN